MNNFENKIPNKGIYSAIDAENIPKEAAADSLSFLSTLNGFALMGGSQRVGNYTSGSGAVEGHIITYSHLGDEVHLRKIETKIQYYKESTDTWTDIITGLTAGKYYTFSTFSSLAGVFVYATGYDGIYKIDLANPASYVNVYDNTKNFKGKSFIDKGRMILWDRPDDPTGLYFSHIDEANYTTVSSEALDSGDGATTNFTGTLSAVSGDRTVFAVSITDGTETFVDNGNGVLTGDQGGTGTINYVTGAYDVTFNSAPSSGTDNITGDYQWEDSNDGGVTDFTYSATRVAGEGDVIRQDKGGDDILNVIPFADNYFSFKKSNIYKLKISDDDETASNRLYRTGVGIPNWQAAAATSIGIVFMNTADKDDPELTVLQQNITGDNFNTKALVPQFDFSKYVFDEAVVKAYGDYVMVACKLKNSESNDRILIYNVKLKSMDVAPYHANTMVDNGESIYAGDSITGNVYEIFSGYDDDSSLIDGYWNGNEETYGNERLKRVRRLKINGFISSSQSVDVYVQYDNGGYEKIGTIDGNGEYVNIDSNAGIGANVIGSSLIGGGESGDAEIFRYIRLLTLKSPKFRKRQFRFVPTGIGHFAVHIIEDRDVQFYNDRLPSQYRAQT